jgi:hypothetical protein
MAEKDVAIPQHHRLAMGDAIDGKSLPAQTKQETKTVTGGVVYTADKSSQVKSK